MENLIIEATQYTPTINFNVKNQNLSIIGKSYPENTFEYYEPVIAWIKEFLDNASDDIISVYLDLEYLNSSSLKAYFDMFDMLEAAHDKGQKVKIEWVFDTDNDICEETGEDFIEDFKSLDIKLTTKD